MLCTKALDLFCESRNLVGLLIDLSHSRHLDKKQSRK